MLSRAWNFLKRHRGKFLVSAAVVGGGIWLGKCALRKLAEWEEKEMLGCCELLRRDTHFDNTLKTCSHTVLSLVPNLKDAIVVHLDSDAYTAVLKMKPTNKVQVWEELKIVAFSRAVSAIYGSCLLVILLEVQMNILGGYLYVDVTHNAKKSEETRECNVSQEVQQKFLDAVQHLLTDGMPALINLLKQSILNVVGPISLKDKLTLADCDKIFKSVKALFETENDLSPKLASILLPIKEGSEEESSNNISLNRILNETRDVLNSADCQLVFKSMVDCGYTQLSDCLAGFFANCDRPNGGGGFVNPHGIAVPLAKLIPALNNLIFSQCSVQSGQLPQVLLQLEPLKILAGNIYEAFSQLQNSEDVQNHNKHFA